MPWTLWCRLSGIHEQDSTMDRDTEIREKGLISLRLSFMTAKMGLHPSEYGGGQNLSDAMFVV